MRPNISSASSTTEIKPQDKDLFTICKEVVGRIKKEVLTDEYVRFSSADVMGGQTLFQSGAIST